MLQVLLCDGNQQDRELYANRLLQAAQAQQLLICLSCFGSAEELFYYLADRPEEPDILYMEARLGAHSGIDIAAQLRECGFSGVLIFLTNHTREVFRAFDVNAMHYLLKNNTDDATFLQVLLRASDAAQYRHRETLVCGTGNTRRLLQLREILWFEIWKRVIVANFLDGSSFTFYGTMDQLEAQLEGRCFVRTHRSYLVNLQHVIQYQPQSLLLRTNQSIPIGITHTQQVRSSFAEYLQRAGIHRLCAQKQCEESTPQHMECASSEAW